MRVREDIVHSKGTAYRAKDRDVLTLLRAQLARRDRRRDDRSTPGTDP